jgi:hypothetical protein
MDTGVRRYDERANIQNESLAVGLVSYWLRLCRAGSDLLYLSIYIEPHRKMYLRMNCFHLESLGIYVLWKELAVSPSLLKPFENSVRDTLLVTGTCNRVSNFGLRFVNQRHTFLIVPNAISRKIFIDFASFERANMISRLASTLLSEGASDLSVFVRRMLDIEEAKTSAGRNYTVGPEVTK